MSRGQTLPKEIGQVLVCLEVLQFNYCRHLFPPESAAVRGTQLANDGAYSGLNLHEH